MWYFSDWHPSFNPITTGVSDTSKLKEVINNIKEKRREKDMINFTSNKSTVIGKIKVNTPFKKAKDFIGSYEKGSMKVMGYLKTHSDMYDKDQYSLYVNFEGNYIFINVPTWYGERLDRDFQSSNLTADEYFENASIKEIQTFKTKFNTESVNVVIYE